jgi:hypothetical protein
MRGQFFKVFLAASCFLSACVVAARAAAPPTVTPPTSPTLVPTPSLTPAPTLPPTPPPGAIVLAMVRLYDADVADFQEQTQMGQEVELQGWVYDTLPLLEDQREQIHKIASELGIPVRAGL